MKKLLPLIMILVLIMALSACKDKSVLQDESNSDQGVGNTMFDWANISSVDVYHVKGGTVNEWSINNEQQLIGFVEWFNGLSLVKKQFAKGQNPGDKNGGEIYMFTLNGIDASFSYGIYGDDECYIMTDEWYRVMNPTDPFDETTQSVVGSKKYDLSSEDKLITSVQGISYYRLRTNSEQIRVSLSGNSIGADACVSLYDADDMQEIAVIPISSEIESGTFTNLTSAKEYIIFTTGLYEYEITVSD